MSSKAYKSILWFGIAAVMIFAPLAKGAVEIWSITPLEITVLLLVFLWLWRVNNRKAPEEGGIRGSGIDLPICLFVILAVSSCVFSIYKHASLLEILRLLTMVGVFYLVVNNFGRRMNFRLATLVIIMGAGMSLFGLAQYFLNLPHFWWKPSDFLAATYVNHNHFAGYLELAIPLAVGMVIGIKSDDRLLRSRVLSLRFGLIAALILMFTALAFSQSRGAWASLAISLIIMNLVLVRKKVLPKQSLVIFLLLIVLGVAFISAGYDATARRLQTVESVSGEASLEVRAKIWQGSVKLIRSNSLLGTGIGTFAWGFPAYRPQGLVVRAHYAHNDYLHMMAEMGVLALPLMLGMIFIVLKTGFGLQNTSRATSHEPRATNFNMMDGIRLGSAVGILSLALHGLIDFNFHIPANMLVVAALAGVIMRRMDGTNRNI